MMQSLNVVKKQKKLSKILESKNFLEHWNGQDANCLKHQLFISA